MYIVLAGLGIVSILELLLWTPPAWRIKHLIASVLSVVLAVLTVALLVTHLSTWTIVVGILSIYRVLNLRRVQKARMQARFLYQAARRTELWLIGMQLFTALLSLSVQPWDWAWVTWWYGLALLQVIGVAILLVSLMRHAKTTSPTKVLPAYADKDLPTVTVAIPARNETAELQACLESLVTSDYPKLEILVLDDCSQNKRTPEIIRDFAQAGVRFIAGKEPPASWLAKNYAYQQLLEASNGDVIVFCGVDTRFKPDSLRALIGQLLARKKSMLSVLPINHPTEHTLLSLLIQPTRYAWEITLPRRMLRRPPVLSTCWLITRDAIEATGGFAAARRRIVPESYFARETAHHDDAYSFLHASPDMSVVSHKAITGQKATAIRTRYPQLRRRPELVALVCLASFALLVWPPILMLVGLITTTWALVAFGLLSTVLASILYGQLVRITYRRTIIKSMFLAPVAALYDIGLLNYSLWQYEFSTVIWKDRNVCLPVMRATGQAPQGSAQK